MTLEEALKVVGQLSLIDKVRLMEVVAPQIRQALLTQQPQPQKSVRGRWRGTDTTDEDIAESRRNMMSFGVFSGEQQSTEADFRAAEFQGDSEDGLDWL